MLQLMDLEDINAEWNKPVQKDKHCMITLKQGT